MPTQPNLRHPRSSSPTHIEYPSQHPPRVQRMSNHEITTYNNFPPAPPLFRQNPYLHPPLEPSKKNCYTPRRATSLVRRRCVTIPQSPPGLSSRKMQQRGLIDMKGPPHMPTCYLATRSLAIRYSLSRLQCRTARTFAFLGVMSYTVYSHVDRGHAAQIPQRNTRKQGIGFFI